MGNNNIDTKNYYDDILQLNPSIAYEFHIIKKLKLYENFLDCNYIKKYNEILNKYKDSIDDDLRNMIRLELKKQKIFDENLIPLTSFENSILNFHYEFGKNKLIKHNFNNFVDNCIEYMRNGIKKK